MEKDRWQCIKVLEHTGHRQEKKIPVQVKIISDDQNEKKITDAKKLKSNWQSKWKEKKITDAQNAKSYRWKKKKTNNGLT